MRELEGLLIRVAAFAALQEQPITIEFAKETLKNFLTQAAHSLTVEAVQKEVANYFNVKLADIKCPKRHQAIARPRADRDVPGAQARARRRIPTSGSASAARTTRR